MIELRPSNARIVPVDTPRAKPQLVHINRLKRAKYQGPQDVLHPAVADEPQSENRELMVGARRRLDDARAMETEVENRNTL